MKKFNHLSQEQRYQIQALQQAGYNQTETAKIIGVDKSTISRELKRNTPRRGRGAKCYNATRAHIKTMNRHEQKPKRIRFTGQMKKLICRWMLQDRLSPELIVGRAAQLKINMVSHETIYEWIWKMKHSHKRKDFPYQQLYRYLRHGKRRRKRGRSKDSRGIIPNRTPIEKRPKIVNKRKRIGDIEIDLMMGKNHKSALLVITDRATIKTKLRKLTGKNSRIIAKKTVAALQPYKPFIKTITFDNDMAFADHQFIANSLNAFSFFTRPYTAQDKGTVENRIGVIRMFLPKKTDLNPIPHQTIRKIENKINNRPVRKFNYLTPNQLFSKKLKVAFMT